MINTGFIIRVYARHNKGAEERLQFQRDKFVKSQQYEQCITEMIHYIVRNIYLAALWYILQTCKRTCRRMRTYSLLTTWIPRKMVIQWNMHATKLRHWREACGICSWGTTFSAPFLSRWSSPKACSGISEVLVQISGVSLSHNAQAGDTLPQLRQ